MAGMKRTRDDETKGSFHQQNEAKSTIDTTTSHRARSARPRQHGRDADAFYRALYASEPDFQQLGRDDPVFGSMLRSGNLDFRDPQAVIQLTKTLLRVDFGLRVELPSDRLCPPVFNRHNYILWLKSLMDSTSYDEPGQKLMGLDIGTGASCIYPLLGCTQRDWSFLATDIDEKSLACAKRNVELNDLQGRIKVLARKTADALIPTDDIKTKIDFIMTNPPFYESEDELLALAEAKSRPPFSACTGASHEMITRGGEVAFVGRILEESLVLRDEVQWYTSMLGKQSSLETLVEMIRAKGIDNYAVTEFVQGNKTRRWAIGWSFAPMRPSAGAARGLRLDKWKKILPPPVEADILTLPLREGVGRIERHLHGLLGSLELISGHWDKEKLRGIGRAKENVWSRAWRRKKARQLKEGQPTPQTAASVDDETVALGFEIGLELKTTGMHVLCIWREGHDYAIFESFCGFLKTQLKAITGEGPTQAGKDQVARRDSPA